MADNFDTSAINSWWNTPTTTPRTTTSSTTVNADASIIDQSPSSSHLNNIMDSSFPSNFTLDNYWNQSLLRSSTSSSSGTIRAEPSFHSMLQDPMTTNYDPSIESSQHQFLLDHQQQQAHHGFLMSTSQGLFDAQLKAQQPVLDQGLMSLNNYQTNDFWNNTASASSTAYSQVTYPSVPAMPAAQFGNPSFEQKPSCSSRTTKSNLERVSKRSGSGSGSSSSSTEVTAAAATALKKPRVQTLSPLPTFKVRKEKLGDRIAALQQLVSPFGKTDTASVLHEAIEYIKFLHDQVNVLSTPYLKNNGHPMQHQQSSDKYSKDEDGQRQDLRSRGLCLVPVECTYLVASETTADFWTPGSYR